MNGWAWLALTPLVAVLLWTAWWSWSGWRREVRAAKAAARFARFYRTPEPAELVRTAMGKHHLFEPDDTPVWPTVDPDEPVDEVSPVRPYVQDFLSTSVMPRPVLADETPTLPSAVRRAGLDALGIGGSDKPEHDKCSRQSPGLGHDRRSQGSGRDDLRADPPKGRHALDGQ
jgi:hypothetical protein